MSRKSKSHSAQVEHAVSGKTRRIALLLTAFLAGAAVMVIELAGNRVLAPWFGNSLYTWTGLIGVIMISISGGYYLGGYLADRRPDFATLSHLLAAAAVLTMLIPLLQPVGESAISPLGTVWGPVFATLLLFALPGCLLATVSPFAIRLISLISHDKHVGVSAGSIGMFGTFGSVIGTFGAGFVLIPHVDVRTIFIATGGVLAVLAVAGYVLFARGKRSKAGPAALLLGFAAIASVVCVTAPARPETVVFEQTTFYHRIRVIEEPVGGDVLRTLKLDTTTEGQQYVKSRSVPMSYQRYWELSKVLCPRMKRAAFLGGGAFAMPEALLDAYPDARCDVIEIDPAVIAVGRKYFRVDEYPNLNAIPADARRHLRMSDAKYDFIFGDAYNGVLSIPAHLVTREFFALVKSRMTDDGVFMMNVISQVEGEHSMLFKSIFRTLSEVFESVDVIKTEPSMRYTSQNLIIVAGKSDLRLGVLAARHGSSGGRLGRLLSGHLKRGGYDVSDGLVLTDNRNPVEYIVAKAARDR